MTKVIVIFFLFLKLCLIDGAFSQIANSEIEESLETNTYFFDALRAQDIDLAKKIAIDKPSGQERNLTINLIKVYTGDSVKIKYDLSNLTNHQRILYHLAYGYQILNSGKESKLIAYQNFSKAIQIADEINFNAGLKFALISMLNLLKKEIFLGTDKFSPYLEHYKELRSDFTDDLIISLYEIALKSKENDDFESVASATKEIERFDSLFKTVSQESPFKVEYYYRKAIQAKLGQNYKESLEYFHLAIKLMRKKEIHQELYNTSIWQLSSVFYLLKESDSAKFYLEKSRQLTMDLRSKFYDDRLASWIYNQIGANDSAYYFLNKSVEAEYKLNAKTNSLESSLLSVENQTEKLKLDKLRLDNRRKTNQNYLILAISLLAIGAITAFFLQKNTTKKRKLAEQEALIEQQKVETLLKEQELVSLDAMIAGQEKERQKVANELHDDLGSLMATVKLHFDNVKVDEKDPAMKSAQDLLEKAYQKIRGMAHAKNSGVMANQGLLPAVQKMARTINETKALEVSVEDFGLADRMENSLELTIFRILQELITNIIKHAEATKASIQFTQHEDNMNIIVEDNGKGFDMSVVTRTASGMGLGTIEKRIEHLEGTFTVDSVLGKGTSILIDIPV